MGRLLQEAMLAFPLLVCRVAQSAPSKWALRPWAFASSQDLLLLHLKMGTRSNYPGRTASWARWAFLVQVLLASRTSTPATFPCPSAPGPSCCPLNIPIPVLMQGRHPCKLSPLLEHLPPTLSHHHSWGWFPVILQTFSYMNSPKRPS